MIIYSDLERSIIGVSKNKNKKKTDDEK